MSFSMTEESRLSRIESKLDQLADAMVSLVRVEERLITLFKRVDAVDTSIVDAARRLTELERTSEGRGHAIRFVERVFWIVVTAAVGAAFVYLRGD